ncbi:MAG: M91 family zinc metallopeptidase [Dehalococcoidia bacterium]
MRYEGKLTIAGSTPARVGTKISVVTARNADDVTVCGTGTVTKADGSYSVDVSRTPPAGCLARTATDLHPQHIFIVNGERVQVAPTAGRRLDQPSTLGGVVGLTLRQVAIAAPVPPTAVSPLIARRYHGRLTYAPTGGPLPAGTTITLITARSGSDTTVCGTGQVSDANGNFVLDVKALPGVCIARTYSDLHPRHIFVVNGAWAGDTPSSGLRWDDPPTLAGTYGVTLDQTPIPALASTPPPTTSANPLIVRRYYGRLTVTGGAAAPVGTTLNVRSSVDADLCGTGRVVDANGNYVLDVRQGAGRCVARNSTETAPTHVFFVGTEQLGLVNTSGVRWDEPETLAHARGYSFVSKRLVGSAVPLRRVTSIDPTIADQITGCFQRFLLSDPRTAAFVLALDRAPAAGATDTRLTIERTTDSSRSRASDAIQRQLQPNGAPGKGSNATLLFNPDFSTDIDNKTDPCIIVLHELVHATDSLNGIIDQTEVSLPNVAGPSAPRVDLPRRELKAVREENRYRLAQGRSVRTTYGSAQLPSYAVIPDQPWPFYPY